MQSDAKNTVSNTAVGERSRNLLTREIEGTGSQILCCGWNTKQIMSSDLNRLSFWN